MSHVVLGACPEHGHAAVRGRRAVHGGSAVPRHIGGRSLQRSLAMPHVPWDRTQSQSASLRGCSVAQVKLWAPFGLVRQDQGKELGQVLVAVGDLRWK